LLPGAGIVRGNDDGLRLPLAECLDLAQRAQVDLVVAGQQREPLLAEAAQRVGGIADDEDLPATSDP
jgi:hypothetical protein